jgi:hypothetical protein
MHVILCSPCIYKRGEQGPFQGDRRWIHTQFDSSRASVPPLHILRPESSSLSHQLVTRTISTSVQGNTRLSSPLDVGYSSVQTTINRLCSSCTPSRYPTRKRSFTYRVRAAGPNIDSTKYHVPYIVKYYAMYMHMHDYLYLSICTTG